jgi:diaminopimelate epimerase
MTMMKFVKYQGCGNDAILLEQSECAGSLRDLRGFEALVRRACDRTRGIGADVVLVLSSPQVGVDADLWR